VFYSAVEQAALPQTVLSSVFCAFTDRSCPASEPALIAPYSAAAPAPAPHFAPPAAAADSVDEEQFSPLRNDMDIDEEIERHDPMDDLYHRSVDFEFAVLSQILIGSISERVFLFAVPDLKLTPSLPEAKNSFASVTLGSVCSHLQPV
jgi:hypothetical protein